MVKPTQINIEITTRCSARCIMCPHQVLDRKNRDMPVDDILDILDQAYAMGVRKIHPHFFGEPMMHPQYAELLYKLREAYPEAELLNYTNGYGLLDDDIRKAVIDNLDRLVISIEGATNETMKKIRPGLDPERIRCGVIKLWEDKGDGKPSVAIRMTGMPENVHEKKDYVTAWQDYSNHIQITYLQDFHGFKELETKKRSKKPCPRPFFLLTVTVNKNVVLCCDDYMEDAVLGNLEDNTLEEIWSGEVANRMRDLHLTGRLDEIEMCSKCTYLGVYHAPK